MITQDILEQFKNRMRISHDEDDNLQELLSSSIAYVKSRCGDFDIEGDTENDKAAKELVFERTRYLYNDAVEFFEDNFLSEITHLGLMMAGVEDG